VAAVENGVQSELSLCARDNYSPIALDLPGHGKIKRIPGEFSVDLNNDGVDELLTEWFAPTAGILVTADASGQVSGEHLFGNIPGAFEDGFAELATLDIDRDGQLTGTELEGLAVWTDIDSDTVVDDNELQSLEFHGITAMPTTHYKFMARASKENDETILMEDVWLPAAFISAQR